MKQKRITEEDGSDSIKAPNTAIWWLIACAICLSVCIGGFFLIKHLSPTMCIFSTGGNDCTSALFSGSFGVVNVLLIFALAFASMIVTFGHLYTILKFIQQNDWLGEQEQYKYATFVRATLSRYEFVMLYYNGFLHPMMKKLMETYCMLNNLCSELFPLSFENPRYLQGLGTNYACELTANHFSGGYFEFFLSDEEGDSGKYYLGAFYAKTELDKGRFWNSGTLIWRKSHGEN